MQQKIQNTVAGDRTSIRTPASKSILLGVMRELQEFDEDTLVKEFANKMSEEVTPVFARDVREVVSDLAQYGLLVFRNEKYYFKEQPSSIVEVQNSLRAPKNRTILINMMHALQEFDDDTLARVFAVAVGKEPTPKFARRVRAVIYEFYVDYPLLGFKNGKYYVKK